MLEISNNLIGWIAGAGLTALSAIAIFFPNLAPRFVEKVVMLIPGLIPGLRYNNWPEARKQAGRAQRRVWILQTWLPNLKEEIEDWEKALQCQKMDFRVLLAAKELTPFRLRYREVDSDTHSELIGNIGLLKRLNEKTGIKSHLQVRFYSCITFGPIYIIDDDIFWGLYTADKCSMKGPAFHCKVDSIAGRRIVESYEVIWEKANLDTEGLGLIPNKPPVKKAQPHDSNEEVNIRKKTEVIARFLTRQTYDNVIKLEPNKGYLCILRHVETDLNAAEIITGDLEIGINAVGRKQARALANQISREKWDHIYTSPLRRCVDTLIEARGGNESNIESIDVFKERDMGDAEGYSKKTYAESLIEYEGVDILTSFHTKANNGETYCDVFWRIFPQMENLVARVIGGERILICSHEGPIRMMVMMLNNLSSKEAVKIDVGSGEIFYYLPR